METVLYEMMREDLSEEEIVIEQFLMFLSEERAVQAEEVKSAKVTRENTLGVCLFSNDAFIF